MARRFGLRVIIVHVGCAVVVACGGAQPGADDAHHVKAGKTHLTGGSTIPLDTAVIERQSTATVREVAVVELSQQLAVQLLGPEWAPQLQRVTLAGTDWSAWLQQNVVRQAAGGGFVATLSAAQVEQVLDAVDDLEPAFDARLPAAWQPTLGSAFVAERTWAVCQHREQWLGVPCTVEPPIAERMALSNLFAEVQLAPLLRDGVPVRKDSVLASSVAVRVTQGLQSIAGVPVQLATPDAANEAASTRAFAPRDEAAIIAVSDEQGVCRFSAEHLDVGTRASVALPTLLGPLATLVELPPVSVFTRAVDPKRHVVIEIAYAGERTPITAPTFGPSLQRELGARYGVTMPAVSREVVFAVQTDAVAVPSSRDLVGVSLREQVVNATYGSVDYLVLAWGHSEFASQMGAGRTWYEARVGAKIVDVWSGAIVAAIEESATGAGMSDVAAERAALDAAVHKLTPRVQSALDGATR